MKQQLILLRLKYRNGDVELISIKIIRDESCIHIQSRISFFDEDISEEIEDDDDYEFRDYNIKSFNSNSSSDMLRNYREYLFKKFRNQYAVDYLLMN